jgi:hypothetical protein
MEKLGATGARVDQLHVLMGYTSELWRQLLARTQGAMDRFYEGGAKRDLKVNLELIRIIESPTANENAKVRAIEHWHEYRGHMPERGGGTNVNVGVGVQIPRAVVLPATASVAEYAASLGLPPDHFQRLETTPVVDAKVEQRIIEQAERHGITVEDAASPALPVKEAVADAPPMPAQTGRYPDNWSVPPSKRDPAFVRAETEFLRAIERESDREAERRRQEAKDRGDI